MHEDLAGGLARQLPAAAASPQLFAADRGADVLERVGARRSCAPAEHSTSGAKASGWRRSSVVSGVAAMSPVRLARSSAPSKGCDGVAARSSAGSARLGLRIGDHEVRVVGGVVERGPRGPRDLRAPAPASACARSRRSPSDVGVLGASALGASAPGKAWAPAGGAGEPASTTPPTASRANDGAHAA